MAGAPCPEELCKAVVDELGMKDFVVAYGMTETSPVTFQGFPDDAMLLKTSTVGYPMDHQEVKVVDNEGKTVGVGEVKIRGVKLSAIVNRWANFAPEGIPPCLATGETMKRLRR